jgi:TonB family protein
MALNNQEAKIHIGTRDAYITSTTSQSGSGTSVTSQSVNFVDWGIQLSVTPTISRDDFITMKIKPEVSDSTRTDIKSENQITQIPIITTSEAETTVMVKDGVTIIMGGLTKDKREKTVKKIPVIGDIPGLGFFFRSTSDNVTKTDLVILLTPHIVSGEYPITEPEEIRPKEGAFAKMVNGKIVTEKVSRKDISLDEYYQSLLNRVQAFALFDRSRKEKGEIKLAFTLSNKGKLVNEPEVLETTNPGLNQYALKAIRQSSPFPPFPKGLDKKEETFKVTLSCE